MNEMIKEYIGKEVIVTEGYSTGVAGIAVRIEENWLEIEDNPGISEKQEREEKGRCSVRSNYGICC